MEDVIIYHNPDCGTSRNTLGLIRNAGVEPHIIEYRKTPPTRRLLTELLARAGLSVRQILRERGTPYCELGLDDPSLSDEILARTARGLTRGPRNSDRRPTGRRPGRKDLE